MSRNTAGFVETFVDFNHLKNSSSFGRISLLLAHFS